MKKHILRIIALLIFASAISSCSIEYREHHRHWDHDRGDRDHDNHDHDYHYNA
ncbi:MAG TPA: hypothetical protein VIM16_18690 [Mucilaginibacter sp.]